MDRRFVSAIVLMMAVLILPSLLFRSQRPAPRPPPAARDSAPVRVPLPPPVIRGDSLERAEADSAPFHEDTVVVRSPLYRYAFSTRGGRMLEAALPKYRSIRRGESDKVAQILAEDSGLLGLSLIAGGDTIRVRDWVFTPSATTIDVTQPSILTLKGAQGGWEVRLDLKFRPDDYRFDVSGLVEGIGPNGATLLVDLGPGLRNTEADSVDHGRQLGLVTKDTRSVIINFAGLKVGTPLALAGPFEWVAVKSKYFVTGLLAFDTTGRGQGRVGGARVVATDRMHKTPERADIEVSIAVPASGTFGFGVYAGPMEQPRLKRIGHDFDNVNPYGWAWLRPIIRPVAVGARGLLVWFHEQLGLAYGVGLILFGIFIRLALWPLNQKAMRASMQMQAIQPVLKELQERYKNEPQRLQQEMFKVYKEHRVNPMSGCWPLLLPWPILIALFFTFGNTIELRGASFLWLPDLSRPDPIYVIPVIMGLSMFAVSKVGQIGLPPNPQMKLMLYMMPVMFTVMFSPLASGLNLYYTVQNIASIPQQWLVAQRRLQQQPLAPPVPTKVASKR